MALFTSFKGNNKLRPKQAFQEKIKYQFGLFTQQDFISNQNDLSIPQPQTSFPFIPKPMINFYVGEKQFYGKVDDILQPVYAKKEKLKPISNKDAVFVLDFVAKKFAELKQNFVKCITVGSISKDDPYLSVLKPFKAYISIENEYKKYISSIIESYNKTYLVGTRKINDIIKFEQYINSLLDFSKTTSETIPLTNSCFLKTKLCPMNVSGLVIELADFIYSDDEIKYNFTNSPNFKFFLNACIKHGFSIDYNAPWRIIADIDSPPMMQAMQDMGYDRTTIFTSHFNNATILEVENIKKILYNGYSNLIRVRPQVIKLKECKSKITTQIFDREQISIKSLNNLVDNSKIIEIYISIRNSELQKHLSPQARENLIRNANSYLKGLGIEAALLYVEQQMLKNELAGSGTINTIMLDYKKRTQGM